MAQTSPQRPVVFATQGTSSKGLTRIYPMRKKDSASSEMQRSVGDSANSGATPAGGPNLQYYGGPVISSVQVVVVYWGNDVSSVATAGIPDFFNAVTNSNWADALSEYSTNGVSPVEGGSPGNQSISRGTMTGVYTITPSTANSGSTIDDTQIQSELTAQIDAGNLPAAATDSTGSVTMLYMIYFPPGVTITLQGAESCVQFCAYHGTVRHNSLDVPYGVLPDLGPTTSCSTGCAGGTEFDDLTTVSSHELAESITDEGVGLATSNAPPLAWYDTTNGEIGDICNASGDPANQSVLPGTNYTVQKVWSNLQGACIAAPPIFTLSAPASVLSGTPFTVSLSVQSSTGTALNPPYTGTVAFSSGDSSAVLPANYTFTTADANAHTFTNISTLKASGSQTITVTDTLSGGFTGTTQVTVNAHTSPYFTIAVPYVATTGLPFTITVTALTASGNLNTAYTGTVHFTSSDAQAALPGNATLTNGAGAFTVTLRTSGSQTITVTDTAVPAINGTSANITTSGPATHFSVVAPASATTGTAFTIRVTALDQSNSTATNYSGTVHFTSSDPQGLLPANATLANGTGTFNATMNTVGLETITATDLVTAAITGAATISVGAATSYFVVSAPASATAGNAFTFTVTAKDQSNNTATGYSGTVRFTSSDSLAVLPANSILTNGTGSFSAILKSSGTQTITASDTANSAITGVSGGISVAIAPPAAIPSFSPNPGTYNSPQSVTMTDSSPGVTIFFTTDGSTPTTNSAQYSGPISVSTTTTLQAIAAGNGFATSAEDFGIYKIASLAPAFSPNPGTYYGPQTVTISDATPGVTIYYTTDGSIPTTASPHYTGPITLSSTTTLQAIAAGNGYAAGSEAFGIYRISALAPTFSPTPGTYNTPQTVTISDASPGVTIYYTIDGSTPTATSPQYAGPITLSAPTTLQAIAAGNGFSQSSTNVGIYRISIASPTFSPAPGSYSAPQSVTISDASPGVTIYYTTDGSIPTIASAIYGGPIKLSATTTLQAIAAMNGGLASAASVGVYKFGAAVPTFSPAPGSYAAGQLVTITDSSPGVIIYYTTDGSAPTTSSTPYTGPLTLATTTTLQAIAAGNGYPASAVGGGLYKIATAAPTFSPNPGTYTTAQSVTISDASPGATIYYTTDGSTPTTTSPKYTVPIPIASTTTLQAIAAGNGNPASSDTFGTYRIVAASPTFSPNPSTYNTPQFVKISDTSVGATIYYTTDGSTPTTASPRYTGPIVLSTTTTLQAIAAGNGYAASSENFGIYRITALPPTFSPNPGTYTGPQTVTISDATPGVNIYYTTDGSTPTTASPHYSGPITLSATTTLQAIAVGNGYAASAEDFGIYRIN